jgi:hypothetical protein
MYRVLLLSSAPRNSRCPTGVSFPLTYSGCLQPPQSHMLCKNCQGTASLRRVGRTRESEHVYNVRGLRFTRTLKSLKIIALYTRLQRRSGTARRAINLFQKR